MTKIAHIGYGWLAKIIEKENQESGKPFSLYFFNRSKKEGSLSYDLNGNQSIPEMLSQAQILSVSIPPGKDLEKYYHTCLQLKKIWPKESPILFVSTTSVFPRKDGTFYESSIPNPDNKRGLILRKIESELHDHFSQSCILRSAGQVGENRHPLKFLLKNKKAVQGEEPINMIYGVDLANLVLKIFTMWTQGDDVPAILHGVSPLHPLKKNYYTLQSKTLNLPDPKLLSDSNLKRVIDSEILPKWDFKFKNKDCILKTLKL